jgi:hypothetical protein
MTGYPLKSPKDPWGNDAFIVKPLMNKGKSKIIIVLKTD